jgi:glyoxylase-like metal-dependent hydrolase (beta-lactamase superfamily II)
MSIIGQHLVSHVLLLETSHAGLVLVDSGLGSADYAAMHSRLGFAFSRLYARPTVDPSPAAVEQVKRLGFAPGDVRHIFVTHLDLDHVGGLSDFPDAQVHVHATELQMASNRNGFKARSRYRPKMWTHGPKWPTYAHAGEPWMGFSTVRDLEDLGEDILMVPLFGHTHGHVGIAVKTSRGWLPAAGDAYFDARDVELAKRVCGAPPAVFQMLVTDLVERSGDTPPGISTTRWWNPANRASGADRDTSAARNIR